MAVKPIILVGNAKKRLVLARLLRQFDLQVDVLAQEELATGIRIEAIEGSVIQLPEEDESSSNLA